MCILIKTFFGFIGIVVEPFHEWEIETGPLVHELGGMKMQVAESRE